MHDKTEVFTLFTRFLALVDLQFNARVKMGWKVYDLETKESFVSRDVKFVESIFPFSKINDHPVVDSEQIGGTIPGRDPKLFVIPDFAEIEQQPSLVEDGNELAAGDEGLATAFVGTCEEVHEARLGRGMRVRAHSVRLRAFVVHTIIDSSTPLPHPTGYFIESPAFLRFW
ncbi:hypothetical protein LIER_07190 [Lithospermum erythrorhizon]|uniref:Retroviral polymerase SH3-like domain-containing protein n=1 Tax=Lithospermum erythrorhizon TaxID=34254 RepID=A0AAV3PBW6_LITER